MEVFVFFPSVLPELGVLHREFLNEVRVEGDLEGDDEWEEGVFSWEFLKLREVEGGEGGEVGMIDDGVVVANGFDQFDVA